MESSYLNISVLLNSVDGVLAAVSTVPDKGRKNNGSSTLMQVVVVGMIVLLMARVCGIIGVLRRTLICRRTTCDRIPMTACLCLYREWESLKIPLLPIPYHASIISDVNTPMMEIRRPGRLCRTLKILWSGPLRIDLVTDKSGVSIILPTSCCIPRSERVRFNRFVRDTRSRISFSLFDGDSKLVRQLCRPQALTCGGLQGEHWV